MTKVEMGAWKQEALELLHELADESIDLIICDGPYGVTTNAWDRVANIQVPEDQVQRPSSRSRQTLAIVGLQPNSGEFGYTDEGADGFGIGAKQLTYKSKELVGRDVGSAEI
jgi:hypothetical protein